MGTGGFKPSRPFGDPHICVFYSSQTHCCSVQQVCCFPHHTSMKKALSTSGCFQDSSGQSVLLQAWPRIRAGPLHSSAPSTSDGSSHSWQGGLKCWLQCYFLLQPGEASKQNELCRVWILLGYVNWKMDCKSSCVRWWSGAEKQTQSEKQVPHKRSKARKHIILLFLGKRANKKNKQKNQGSLSSSQNQWTPQKPKERNPKQGMMSTRAVQAVCRQGKGGSITLVSSNSLRSFSACAFSNSRLCSSSRIRACSNCVWVCSHRGKKEQWRWE